jgi:type IV pilus assembly protein PilB
VVFLTTVKDLDGALDRFYSADREFVKVEEDRAETDSHAKETLLEAKRLGVDRPIVRLVNLILSQAMHRNASDVHIRPGQKSVEVLFCIDGQHFLPQDGQTRVVERDVVIDTRISIIPTVDGESVVMPLLNIK